MITLITPTRHRPKDFSYLETYVQKQTLKPDRWIVCCDGDISQYKFTMGQEVIHRTEEHVLCSLCANYLTLMDSLKNDEKIVVLEDDDWIRSDYLAKISEMLDEYSLVGFCPALYYHITNRAYCQRENFWWASLGCTGFRKEVSHFLAQLCCWNEPMMDATLWSSWTGEKHLEPNNGYHVALKDGTGIGLGHLLIAPVDRSGEVLRAWLGEDADHYPGEVPEDAPEGDEYVIFECRSQR